MLNIVLFGPPGAGKGTQAAKLIEKYHLMHLSTGDLLRSEIERGTYLGLEAKNFMDQGALVPDEIVIGMISNKLDINHTAKGFIFDGFPRTTAQAVALDELMQSKGSSINLMLALDVNEGELVSRLINRGKDSGRSDDVNENIIRNRIVQYNQKTAPLKVYYGSQSKFHSVNGIGSVDSIFDNLCTTIELALSRPVAVTESSYQSSAHVQNVVNTYTPTIQKVEKAEPVVSQIEDIEPIVKIVKVAEVKKEAPVVEKKTDVKPPAKEKVVKKSRVLGIKKKSAPKKKKVVAKKKAATKKKPVAKKKTVAKKKVKKVAAKKVVKKKPAPKKKPAKKTVKKVVKKVKATKKTKKKIK